VQVADGDASGEDSVVLYESMSKQRERVDGDGKGRAHRVARSHGGGRLSGEVVELDGGDTLVYSSYDTLGDLE